jgi:hypothetical protein
LLVAAAVRIGKTRKLQSALQCMKKEIVKEREGESVGKGEYRSR